GSGGGARAARALPPAGHGRAGRRARARGAARSRSPPTAPPSRDPWASSRSSATTGDATARVRLHSHVTTPRLREISVGDEEEQASETRALIGLLGRVSGLSELPSIGDVEPTPLPDANEAVKQLSAAQHVPGPVRLEVLARMVRAQTHDNLTVADPTPLAAS